MRGDFLFPIRIVKNNLFIAMWPCRRRNPDRFALAAIFWPQRDGQRCLHHSRTNPAGVRYRTYHGRQGSSCEKLAEHVEAYFSERDRMPCHVAAQSGGCHSAGGEFAFFGLKGTASDAKLGINAEFRAQLPAIGPLAGILPWYHDTHRSRF